MKSKMQRSVMLDCVALLVISLSCVANVHAQPAKIGYVNTERVFREAAPAKAAEAKLTQEFSRREKELQDLAADLKGRSNKLDMEGAQMPEADRVKRQRELVDLDRDFQRRQAKFREDVNQRHTEERAAFLERTTHTIKEIAETEKFDIVVQQAVWFGPHVDITDKVLKALNK